MTRKIFKIHKGDTKEISIDVFGSEKENDSSLFIYDLIVEDRNEGIEELKWLKFPEEIYGGMLEPSEHIRFEYIDNILYGELAYFSLQSRRANFASIIIQGNRLFTVHEDDVNVLPWIFKSIPTLSEKQKSNLSCEFLVYILVLEILSNKGKLMISLREKIENLAMDMNKKGSDISPGDFLEAKTQLSDLSRVLEKLIFTISFPPAKDLINLESPYNTYFRDLSKNLDLLISSIDQTEERLNSLHDHFELLLQEKSNRQLNFLTIMQAIFVPLTLIAGIYGMNFKNMPELEYKYGYFIALGVMVIVALIFIRVFYKRGWFD
jgi:magnesium transporter